MPPLRPRAITNESFLAALATDWNCYWDGSFSTPSDPENYAFKPTLSLVAFPGVQGKFVWSSGWEIEEGEEVRLAAEKLGAVQARLEEMGVSQCLLGSESDYPYFTLLLPPGTELDPGAVLEVLGAHAELKKRVRVVTPRDDEEDERGRDIRRRAFQAFLLERDADAGKPGAAERLGAWEKEAGEVWDWLAGEDGWPLLFYAGSEKLNPVPMFLLGRLGGGVVGGFMSAVVHT